MQTQNNKAQQTEQTAMAQKNPVPMKTAKSLVPQEASHPRFTGTISFHKVEDNEHDLRVLSEISRATFYDTFIYITRADDMEAYLDNAYSTDGLRKQVTMPGSTFYFLLADGKLAGYLKLNTWRDDNNGAALSDPMMRHPGAFEIERLYVIPAFKHRGLGKALMHFAEQQAQAAGADTMWLGVWEGNVPAQHLYTSQGFRLCGSHTFQVGHDPQTDLIMNRPM